jgi:Effector-associated domain 2/Trypsin-like peptidase domain
VSAGSAGARVADPVHRAAVALTVGGVFRGSGFFTAGGLVVTSAQVVAGAADVPVVVTYPEGSYEVPPGGIRVRPERGDDGWVFPYPELAVLSGPGQDRHATARLAAGDPAAGTEVTALGYSSCAPAPGVRPDRLVLRVGSRSGDVRRMLGDEGRDGLSGSMLVDADGLVVGVLRSSRSFADARGGWFTPVSALRALPALPGGPGAVPAAPPGAATAPPRGPSAGGVRPATTVPAPPPVPPRVPASAPAAAPTDTELTDALLAFPALARADIRFDLLQRMGGRLGLPHPFDPEERSAARDHLYRLVRHCRGFRDERAALCALCAAVAEIAPYDRALERLQELIGRAVGGGRCGERDGG